MMKMRCRECNAEIKQVIKPDDPETIELVCGGCGLVASQYEYFPETSRGGAVISPASMNIGLCMVCGKELPYQVNPRGGRKKEYCKGCRVIVHRRSSRKYERKTYQNKGKPQKT